MEGEAMWIEMRGLCMQEVKHGGELMLSGKTKKSIEQWKLTVERRLIYKNALITCISYYFQSMFYFSL